MVQILLVLIPVVVAAGLTVWLVKRNQMHKRYNIRRHRSVQPDFTPLEGEHDDAYFSTAAAFDRGGGLLLEEPDDSGGIADSDARRPEITSVVEPRPIGGTRVTVRQSCMRAVRHMERSTEALEVRDDYVESEAFALAALHEINRGMKRDHWYAPYVLNRLGYLRYKQGFTVEARDYWEQAEQCALEWFEQCHDVLQEIRHNLRVFHKNF